MSESKTEPQAPKDVPAKDSTGVSVYDVTLQRFVGPVHRGSSAASDAQAFADAREDGHEYVTRKV